MKTIIEKIESRNYVGTAEDAGQLAELFGNGLQTTDAVRGIYLKMTIATVQSDLGVAVRERAAPKGRFKISDELREEHLKAVDKVTGMFYAPILKKLADLPANERNARSVYARIAKTRLRAWIKAGGDIRTLAAARTTYPTLKVETEAGSRTPEQITTAMVRSADSLATSATALAETDKQAAVEAIETVMAQLAASLTDLGVKSTQDPKVAINERRPFRLKEGMFWPAPHGEVRAQ